MIIETDFGGDPDDEASLVRFLHYVNEFDVVGILTTRKSGDKRLAGIYASGYASAARYLNHYAEVVERLKVHDPRYPSYEELFAVFKDGQGSSSDGVDLVLAELEKDDPRPLWFANWGADDGSNSSLNRALDQILAETPARYSQLAGKVHYVGAIWQEHIVSHRAYVGLYVDTFSPDSWFDHFKPLTEMAGGFDAYEDIVNNHGPLAHAYDHQRNPNIQKEGDTMSFLHLIPNGLNIPGQSRLGSWSGRHVERPNHGYWHCNTTDAWEGTDTRDNTLARWAAHLQMDFAARADWGYTADYTKANHHPQVVVNGEPGNAPLELSAGSGELIVLSAAETTDPDEDNLSYEWVFYPEISTYSGSTSGMIAAASSSTTDLTVPSTAVPGNVLHLVLVVTDDGEGFHGNANPLTSYRRVVITVTD